MKKVRIELKPNVESKSFLFFESAEALYTWLVDRDEEPAGSFKVDLERGEFIEAEWRGCEILYHDRVPKRLDVVRLAKAMPTKNASGMMVSVHYGWTVEDVVAFKDIETDEISVTKLTSPSDWRLDLGVLFQDEEDSSSDEVTAYFSRPDADEDDDDNEE